MKWSKKQPTKAGWYWYKEGPDFCVVVKLSMLEGFGLVFDDRLPRDVKSWRGEYAGPIPEPEKD